MGRKRPRPRPAPRANGLEGKRPNAHTPLAPLKAAMGPSAPLLLLFFLSWTGPLQGQQHHLVEYMERRLAALEVRDLFLFSPRMSPHL